MDGSIVVNDKPTISSYNHALYMAEKTQGTLDVNGGDIISTDRTAMRLEGNGESSIDNAKVFGKNAGKNAIVNAVPSSTGELKIGSSSEISNEVANQAAQAISWKGSGTIYISGGTTVEGRCLSLWGIC